MIGSELRNALMAVQFLTRIPVPANAVYDANWLQNAAKYFAAVGATIGCVAAIVLLAASVVFPQPIPVVLAMMAAVLVTGGLHEDGLADSADGLFGGATPERRLAIMKDSSIGTFGVLAVVLVLGLKFASLQALDPVMAAYVLIAAHTGGRFAAVLAMAVLPFAGDVAIAKSTSATTRISVGSLAVSTATFAAVGLAVLPIPTFAACLILGLIAGSAIGWIAWRRIGGYTGDVLGAIEQVFEAAFLCAGAAVIAGPG